MERLILIIALACAGIACARRPRNRETEMRVSAEWLAEHAREEVNDGIDGIAWKWPINKTENANGNRNRWLLRQPLNTGNVKLKSHTTLGLPTRLAQRGARTASGQ